MSEDRFEIHFFSLIGLGIGLAKSSRYMYRISLLFPFFAISFGIGRATY